MSMSLMMTGRTDDCLCIEPVPFLWGLFRCDDEWTFLLSEEDISLFPEHSLTISPQCWKIIKLGGRQIHFNETGIVSAMSRMDIDVSAVHISTASTNCTLVPEEDLQPALSCLEKTLKCKTNYPQ